MDAYDENNLAQLEKTAKKVEELAKVNENDKFINA